MTFMDCVDCAWDVLRDCWALDRGLCCAEPAAASSAPAADEATELGPLRLRDSSPEPGLVRDSLPAALREAALLLGVAEGTLAGTRTSGKAPRSQASLLQGSGSASCCQLLCAVATPENGSASRCKYSTSKHAKQLPKHCETASCTAAVCKAAACCCTLTASSWASQASVLASSFSTSALSYSIASKSGIFTLMLLQSNDQQLGPR